MPTVGAEPLVGSHFHYVMLYLQRGRFTVWVWRWLITQGQRGKPSWLLTMPACAILGEKKELVQRPRGGEDLAFVPSKVFIYGKQQGGCVCLSSLALGSQSLCGAVACCGSHFKITCLYAVWWEWEYAFGSKVATLVVFTVTQARESGGWEEVDMVEVIRRHQGVCIWWRVGWRVVWKVWGEEEKNSA